jgi:hypothetical protein
MARPSRSTNVNNMSSRFRSSLELRTASESVHFLLRNVFISF